MNTIKTGKDYASLALPADKSKALALAMQVLEHYDKSYANGIIRTELVNMLNDIKPAIYNAVYEIVRLTRNVSKQVARTAAMEARLYKSPDAYIKVSVDGADGITALTEGAGAKRDALTENGFYLSHTNAAGAHITGLTPAQVKAGITRKPLTI